MPKRTIKINSLECQPEKITRVRFKITNTANPTKRLPAYVNALRAQGFPNGNQNAQYLGVFLYGPTNSLVEKVFESGNDRNNGWVYQERNRTFYSVQMMLPAQAAKSFTVYFKGGIGPITSVLQPLVLPQKTIIKDSCKQ